MTASSSMSATTHGVEVNDGITTTWIPLTTAWPSSSGCESSLWQVVSNTIAAWDPGYGLTVQSPLSCQPAQVTSWWDANHLSSLDLSATQISLGPIECPAAYTTATTSVNDKGSTFVACCPSSYSYIASHNAGDTGECASVADAGEVIRWVTSDTDDSSWRTTSTKLTNSTSIWGIQVNGWNFPATETATASTGSTASTVTATATATATSRPNNTSSGLSSGAKAGIGVGVSLGVIALIVAGVFIRRYLMKKDRTRRNDQHELAAEAGGQYRDTVQPDPYGNVQKEGHVSELPGGTTEASELP